MSAALKLTAHEALDAGISVIPTRPDKRPALSQWAPYQTHLASVVQVDAWTEAGHNIAYVCGKVSGGLEALDFDQRDAYEDFAQLCMSAGLGDLLSKVVAGYMERSPRGVHLLYRCPDARTTKLARCNGSVAIETRGEGSYIIAAPSAGYELVCGGVSSIVTLTAEERELLHDVARALSEEGAETIKKQQREERGAQVVSLFGEGERPGDEWARLHDWPEILEPHGWKRLWTRSGVTYWRRPGKKEGVSATTNYGDSGLLYVFSTSTGFEANRGYGKFGAYALLEHGGDFRSAARRLADEGYGQNVPPIETVDVSALQPVDPKPPGDAFPMHLLEVPGLLGDLHRYTVDYATHPQPILALASSLAACGALFGRRVSLKGASPNVAVVGLVESGGGKEWTRTAARRAFRAADLEALVAEEAVTSASAIHALLRRRPSCMIAMDEFGRLLKSLRRYDSHGIITEIMSVYGRSSDVTRSKSYAADRRGLDDGAATVVWYPHLSIYGTSVGEHFWEALQGSDAADGFLNRFLIFASETPNPKPRDLDPFTMPVPGRLVDAIAAWHPKNDLAYCEALGNPDMEPPPAYALELSGRAESLVKSLGDVLHSKVEKAYKANQREEAALYKRTREQALKLALIRAAGQMDPGRWDEVTEADVQWGIDLAMWCAEYALRGLQNHVGDSEHDHACKKVVEWVRGQGGVVKKSALTKRFQRLGKALRDVLLTLSESDQLCGPVKVTGGGRPAEFFHLPEAFVHGAGGNKNEAIPST